MPVHYLKSFSIDFLSTWMIYFIRKYDKTLTTAVTISHNVLYHVSNPFVLLTTNISALIYLINNYEIKILQDIFLLNTHIFSRFKVHFKYMRMTIMHGTDFTVHKPHPLQAHACVLQRVVA